MADERSTKVQLGCGTLIMIALIVIFFSGGRDALDARREVDRLRDEIVVLQEKVDTLTRAVETLCDVEADAVTPEPVETPKQVL